MFWRIPQDSFFSILSFWFFHNRFLFLSTAGLLEPFWSPHRILSQSLFSLSSSVLSFMYVSIYSPADASPICTSPDTPAGALLRDTGATANPGCSSWINLTLGQHQQIISYRNWQCFIVLPSKYEQYGPTSAPLTAYSLLSLLWCGGTWSAGPLSLHAHTHTHTQGRSPVVCLGKAKPKRNCVYPLANIWFNY